MEIAIAAAVFTAVVRVIWPHQGRNWLSLNYDDRSSGYTFRHLVSRKLYHGSSSLSESDRLATSAVF